MSRSLPKVCQVLHSLTIGGAEVLAARLARRLQDRYEFAFACLDSLGILGEELRREGFAVEVVTRRSGIDLKCARRLAEFFRRFGADVVHAHQYTPFFYALVARAWRRRPPVLFTEHGRTYPDYPRRKRIVFNRLALRRSDRVVAVAEAVRRALVANEGIAAPRIEVIYNGVDVAAFDGSPDLRDCDRIQARAELGIGANELVLVQVARLDMLKDHLTAIRTMQRVTAVRSDVRLLLVGDGPERSRIEAEVVACGLQSQVRLLGTRQDVARWLHAADLYLLTSVSEGIPVTMIEAMAARLPVVATRVGGVSEVVIEGQTGLLAASGDDAAIADAVLRLASDARQRTQMGQAGHDRAEARFSQRDMHEAFARCYEEMLHE